MGLAIALCIFVLAAPFLREIVEAIAIAIDYENEHHCDCGCYRCGDDEW